MDLLSHLVTGFGDALTPTNLMYCLIGVVIGTVIGILPGIGPATGIALLLPLTLALDPLTALIMLAGIYYGCMHGGVITAVLIATPGESSSVVTVMDGHKLARAGRAGPVLAMSAIASFLAGTLTIPFVMAFISVLGAVSLKFGPPETAAIMLIGLLGVIGFVGNSRLKGFSMAAIGILISTVGLDGGTGTPRFTFGVNEMFGGIDLLCVVIGVFALAEVLHSIGIGQPSPIRTRLRDMWITRQDWRDARAPILRGGILGLSVGMLPGAGATVAPFIDYDVERRIAKRKGIRLGTGRMEGVCGPQAAENAAANGAFIPTLSLGIPASASTAILLGGFMLHGIQPGPLLITEEPRLVWGLLASFYIGNLMLVFVNIPMAPLFASILRARYCYLYPAIILLCFVGAYSVNFSMTEVWLAFALGAFGWMAKRYDYPLAPLILGVVLARPLERAVIQSAEIGRGSLGIFLERPIAIALLCVALLMVLGPALWSLLRGRRSAGGPRGPDDFGPTGPTGSDSAGSAPGLALDDVPGGPPASPAPTRPEAAEVASGRPLRPET